MRIVYEILLKIWDKLKKNKFLKFLNLDLKETCWKLETNYEHCWKYDETYKY